MMNEMIEQILISQEYTIRETMSAITEAARKGAPSGIALIVDNNNALLGVVTDGDIRRALVKHVDIDAPIREIMIRNPITIPKGLTELEMLELVIKEAKALSRLSSDTVGQVIVVDGQGRVDDVLSLYELWRSSDQKNKPVCVVGLGFVGLTLAVILAEVGYKVIGFDIKKDIVDAINKGEPPFYESGLAPLLQFHISKEDFKATSTLKSGISDIYMICVGTPMGANDKPDLVHIKSVAKTIGKVLKRRDLVILRSTIPVGTSRSLVLPILENESGLKGGEDFYFAFAPERTVEGKALEELRILPQVIGGYNKRSLDLAANFFSNLNQTIVRVSSLEAAEMVKLVNNSFRDLTFAFANELALICNKWGLDAVNVISAANEGYSRNHIPVPSPGVGGVCLKKDPHIYISSAQDVGLKAELPRMSRKINESMLMFVFRKIESFINTHKSNNVAKVFLVGFAFKGEPETSDLRDSTTVDLSKLMKINTTWELFGYDPTVRKDEIERLKIKGCGLREGFRDADCVLIMNNHRSYRDLDILGLLELMNKPALLFDAWHLFPHEEIEKIEGIVYRGLSGKN